MKENLSDSAYKQLREMLLAGAIPLGSRLSARALANSLEISMTPIRSAIDRLRSEGLLDSRPGVGVFVPMLSRRDIEELYEFRETLECATIGKIAGSLSEFHQGELEKELARQTTLMKRLLRAEGMEQTDQLAQWHSADMEFHFILFRCAGNRLVLEALQALRAKMQFVVHCVQENPIGDIRRTLTEHNAIYRGIVENRPGEAKDCMVEHVRKGRSLVLDAFERRYMENGKQFHAPAPHAGWVRDRVL